MNRKVIDYIVFPVIAILLLLLIAIPTATAAEYPGYRDQAKPVLEADMNPALSREVKMNIGQVTRFDTPDIQVWSDDGTVMLMGRVESPADRERVEMLAREVDGVDRVVNSLNVTLPAADDRLNAQ
ncbi:MAG: hypothetical protein DELT_01509 [Desulfovibrio sp.]